MKDLNYYFKRFKQLGVRRAVSLAIAKKIRTAYPCMINVEVMTTCNLKCKHCRVTYHGNLIKGVDPGFMDYDYFTRIADRISPLIRKALYFQFSTIEPLFHKDIFRMMDYVSNINKNIEYNLLSNGMLLNENNIKELMKRNVPTISISLDGCNAETVESFKTNTKFDRVVENIKLFKRLAGDRIELNAVFVSTRDNIHELVDYVGFCKSLNVDRILINGFMSFLPENSNLYLYSREGNPEVQAVFKEAYDRAKKENINIEFPSLTARPQPCAYTSFMNIDEKGNVSPCIFLARETPFELFSKTTVTKPLRFGNVLDDDPVSIWRDKDYTGFRNKLKDSVIPVECALCADAFGVTCSDRDLKPEGI